MRRVFQPCILGLVFLCGGCGSGSLSTGPTMPAAPHGGNFIALPSDKGFAELMTERSATRTKGAKPTRILAYFYQPDGKTALSPAPTDVKVRLGDSDVKLTPQPEPAGLYASEAGQFPDELRGDLELSCGGAPLQAPFMFH
jgi:hypothetical protein